MAVATGATSADSVSDYAIWLCFYSDPDGDEEFRALTGQFGPWQLVRSVGLPEFFAAREASMRHGHGIQYALLGLVSQNPDGVHGYAIKRQCERVLGDFWQINFGEIYRVLDRLANEGLIQQVLEGADSSRKVYRITEKGQQSLDDFILAPPTDAPRPLRQELAVKLLFAGPARVPEVLKLIDLQRDAYMKQLYLLGVQRRRLERAPVDGFVTTLLIDGAELSVRAELAWLDDVTQKLRERYTL